MARFLWCVFVFGVSVSLIWWPGVKNEAYIFQLIEKERAWQESYLGWDLISGIDGAMKRFQRGEVMGLLPNGRESSVLITVGLAEEEMVEATERGTESPYFRALFALLVLAIGRLFTIIFFILLLLPVLGACWVDGLTQREVFMSKFRMPNSFYFRLSWTGFFVLLELIIFSGLIPIVINPFMILIQILLMGVLLFGLSRNLCKK